MGPYGLLFTVWFPSAYDEHEKSPLWVSSHVYHSSSQIEHENHPWWCVFLCRALLHIAGTFFFHQTPRRTCFGWVLCLMHFTHRTRICRRQGEVERQGEWSANHSFDPERSQLPRSNPAIASNTTHFALLGPCSRRNQHRAAGPSNSVERVTVTTKKTGGSERWGTPVWRFGRNEEERKENHVPWGVRKSPLRPWKTTAAYLPTWAVQLLVQGQRIVSSLPFLNL